MNNSSRIVSYISSFYKISINEIIVVHDELDLLPGVIQLKYGCGHNGHNGLRDIISKCSGKNKFCRIRIGIGRPNSSQNVSAFVLSKFNILEKKKILSIISNVVGKTDFLLKNIKCFQNSKIYTL